MFFLISTILLLAFALLAVIDGFYLHIIKYQLFNHMESKFEHLTHTIRAILFPLIVFFLFVNQNCLISFYLGVLFIVIDLVVLGIDAYVEKDSRSFMGGLPRWEYILHLFVNGFHFASIAVFLAIKLTFTENGFEIIKDLSNQKNFELFHFVAINLLPGAIVLAFIHIFTSIKATKVHWNNLRNKIECSACSKPPLS
ncbi:MAG TPA: hypothetical protein PLL09_03315 [Flavobacterium sp.]|uniref:hypothetical protein n=1 Tax=unclassified Flavobacterium TaxID=196869 RepID=UPI0025B85008|nr:MULTISPECIES: hypothetical protein [unclassified Flavobacterium]HRE76834.1 hypothetical protein [Flavobacterium sp.]